ncbi:MAG TPA: hypothetical protein VMY78_00660 [Solirubrobacteraceae bacterium]|nr:hypothetical protein [Solirubrobacteraceae bacterium]
MALQRNVPLAVALLLAALPAAAAGAAGSAAAQERHAVVAFLPSGGEDNPDAILDRLDTRPQLALGLLSATQGRYSPEQAVLDMSAGSRTSAAVYDPTEPPELDLVAGGDRSGFIFGWSKVLERAGTAPAEITPGLLASRLPGGAAYAGVRGRKHLEAVVAAGRDGDVERVSLGRADSIASRVKGLARRYSLVVAGLPTAARGDAALDALLRDRRPGDLLLVLQTPPRARVPQLLPVGAVGLTGGIGALTSPTTHLPGIVAAIDVPVTVLDELGLAVPDGVKGQPMRADGSRDAAELQSVEARLRVVSGRRTVTFGALMFAWLSLTLGLGVIADRRGIRAGLRIGSLALLWVLPMLLLTGAIAPSRAAEILIVVAGAFALGAVTDRLVRWPRGPLVPAAVGVVSYCVDLAFGSPLIIRSLLGVNPRSGSRFYGLGNELEATLAVMLLVGLAALLWGRRRSRATAAVFAVGGMILALFTGAAQLGADVGGVITVGAGLATATLLMLPGRLSRRRIAVAALVPVAALAALAAIDLVSGGNGHFTRTILQADSAGSLWDVVKRRYTLAFNVFTLGAMPFLTVLGILGVAYAVRFRERIYAPLRGSPGWHAAFIGGLTASIVGALTNDSGPLLFVFGVFLLACATAYVRGSPALDAEGRIR